MDPFANLPIEIIQIIISFLNPKQATQTSILSKQFLQAWSTSPDLTFSETDFKTVLEPTRFNGNEAKRVDDEKARERFVKYVDQTLKRYQKHKLSARKLVLSTDVIDEKFANVLEQWIRKAKEHRVKEVYLTMSSFPATSNSSTNLLRTIFALNELVLLKLSECHLVRDIVQDEGIVNFSCLKMLDLKNARIDEGVLQKLLHSCPLIEEIRLHHCEGPGKIQVPNLPNLKNLHVVRLDDVMVDVKAERLEKIVYGTNHMHLPYQLIIESSRNLKSLSLNVSSITDEHLRDLIAKFPLLEELSLKSCYKITKINVSSRSLRSLTTRYCGNLTEVKIDAPNLNQFDYFGKIVPSFSFASGVSGKRESRAILDFNGNLDEQVESSSFLELRKFLMELKPSDNVSLYISSPNISFDKNSIDDGRRDLGMPEFDEVFLTCMVSATSSTYATLMEGLLWSFSRKILSIYHFKKDEEFKKYLCEELLVEQDRHPNYRSNSSSATSWKNYFKQAKLGGRDNEWRPLHSWKSSADALRNLEDYYILKLSHGDQH